MGKLKRVEITSAELESILKALADPHRYNIVKRLCSKGKPLACGAVREGLTISAATLSHHMRELELAGLIKVMREGKFRSYLPRRDVLKAFLKQIKGDLGPTS